ncbi:nitroreductase family protein [uncultured Draconibacterium sp.]|uniref:nitroreductase family protein n=1 Tax=uncultured Draconibacterium sp. TaxID=1573823 RepID=UPI002AA8906A|nr:nitroreductase family protein [uncultured Draconibacterium sp.]
MIKDLITRNRSYRRFDESVKISVEQILNWIELARLSASGRNAQPLKYAVVTKSVNCAKIFPFLGWAGYLNDWKGPAEGERPVAYIAVIKDRTISENHYCDDGIAMHSILLGAVEEGFGGCMIGSINKAKVAKVLNLDEKQELLWIIALGKPAEKVVVEEAENGKIKYWRDERGVHHVPKRSIDEIVLMKD